MIELPFVLTELAVTTVTVIADVSIILIVASVGAWRYVLSPGYRSAVNDRLATRHPAYRGLVKVAGGTFVVLSVPAIAFVLWLIWRWFTK